MNKASRFYRVISGFFLFFFLFLQHYAFSETAKPYAVDQGTIALWHFDEGQGSVLKDAAGANQGSITGAAWSDGRFGKALKFDGTNYVDCGNAPALNPASALTVEAWFKLTNLDFEGRAWSHIVSKESYRSGYYLDFYLGHLSCGVMTDQGAFVVEVTVTPGYRNQVYDTDWHQAAMTYDGTTLSLYYDNSLIGSTPASGIVKSSPANLWIGSTQEIPARSFQGYIDEVRISNTARKIAEENLADILKDNTVIVKGLARGAGYLKEETARIVLGNDKVEFVFDKTRGGVLTEVLDKSNPSLQFHAPGQPVLGEWALELDGSPSFGSAVTRYQRGEFNSADGEPTLSIFSATPKAQLVQTYTLKDKSPCLICRLSYRNTSGKQVILQTCKYSLSRLALAGSLDNNRFIYPPTWMHLMEGNVKEATYDWINSRYVYGYMQPTDKMMLPYSTIYNDAVKENVSLAGVNSQRKVRVGVLGGESGSVNTLFEIFRMMAPGETEEIKTAILSFFPGDWQKGMTAEKDLLVQEAGYAVPKRQVKFLDDLVILWDGFPGVGFDTFDGMAKVLPAYKAAGINALIIGGRTWFCYFDLKPESGVEGFIPMPQGGYIVPSTTTGGTEGLKRLIDKAHSLDMKIFTWGPTSMAGIDKHSEEATTKPDWWIYDKEGKFNNWYSFMVPGNPASPGWRDFFKRIVAKAVKDYGIDGFWLDSSWQDHQLNWKAPDGWYGGPNGAKVSLVQEIVDTAKSINPDVVTMGEVAGIEYSTRLDIDYLQSFGIWPALKPEEIQKLVVAEELNRISGIRPFGQVVLGQGFYAELGNQESRELCKKYEDSWIAKTFLVSTLDRVPSYFGLNWAIGTLMAEGKQPEIVKGTENNPERLEAERNKQKFRGWFEMFKQVNKVRTENPEVRKGETFFNCLEVSNPAIVHYLRHLPGQDSIVLLNADLVPQSFNLKITEPKTLKLNPSGIYRVKNLMTGKVLAKPDDSEKWRGAELSEGKLSLTLDGYQGAVLKIITEE